MFPPHAAERMGRLASFWASESKRRSRLCQVATFFRRSPGWAVGRSESTFQLLQTQYPGCKPSAEVLTQETGDKPLEFDSGDVRLPTLAILEGLHDGVELFEFACPWLGTLLLIFSCVIISLTMSSLVLNFKPALRSSNLNFRAVDRRPLSELSGRAQGARGSSKDRRSRRRQLARP